VHDEFNDVTVGPHHALASEWPKYKQAILKLAGDMSQTQHLLNELTDEFAEGEYCVNFSLYFYFFEQLL